MPVFILSGKPRLACAVEHVLCAEDICLQKQSGVFYAAVHMAFGGKVYHEVRVEFVHYLCYELAVADVSFDKCDVWKLNLIFDCHRIAGICQCVQYDYFNIVAPFLQQVFHEVGTDESGGSCNEIFFHVSELRV